MDLGLVGAAYNGFRKGQTDYTADQLQMAQDEASLQNVPLAQDAAASGLELRSAKNRAATANAPAEGELSGLNTQLGLGTVKNSLERQPKTLETKNLQEDVTALNTRQQAGIMAMSAFGHHVATGDAAGAQQIAQEAADIGLIPGMQGKKFTGIAAAVADDKSKVYRLTTDTGEAFDLPHNYVAQSMSLTKSGKFKPVTAKDGSVYSFNENTGAARQVAEGNPNAPHDKEPAVVQTAKWLLSSGVAKSQTDAWRMAKSASEKSESAFVAEMLGKTMLPNAKAEDVGKQTQMFRNVWRELNGATAAQPSQSTPAAQTPAATNPAIRGLLGIPDK